MKNLYQQLKALIETNDAFYMVEQVFEGQTFEVFTYRMASYTEFLLDGALECRGHTFFNGQLVSLPMEKFFNLGENPMTMELDLQDVVQIDDKLDGSLISTCYTSNNLPWFTLKSKTAFESPQATDANKLLRDPSHKPLLDFCDLMLAGGGITVNMEYIGPKNRIVLGYPEPQLRVLNVRYHADGSYLSRDIMLDHGLPEEFLTATFGIPKNTTDWVDEVYDMVGIEGYVCTLSCGLKFKLKTKEYVKLHHSKDNVNNPRRLFECCIYEGSDDLRSLFVDDPEALKIIADMETQAVAIYNGVVSRVEKYYNENNKLIQKDYAIKGLTEFPKHEFGLVMALYNGKTIDYKAFLCKHHRSYGIALPDED